MNDRKRLIGNYLSLSGVQAISYILPFITVPYLVRVLGPEKFGLIAFAQAFIGYFALVTEYGFNLSVTREISINRENKARVSEIFSSVMLIKAVLMTVSFLLFCVLVFSYSKFRTEWVLYFVTFGLIVGNVLFPAYIFQGLEQMKQMSLLGILPRLFFTGAIFLFIHEESDYIFLALLNSLGVIVSGVLGFRMALAKFEIRLKMPSFKEIRRQFLEGWYIFVSTVAISLYTISNTFILGLFTGNVVVGYFSAGEKIVKAVTGLIGPLSQTVYPHISKLVAESREEAIGFIRKMVALVSLPMFGLSILLLIFAPYLSDIILGSQFGESVIVIQILSFLPVLIGLSNIFGIQVMLNFGLQKAFSRILMMASILNLALALILVVPYQHVGISISVLLTELFVTIVMFVCLQNNGLKVIQFRSLLRSAK